MNRHAWLNSTTMTPTERSVGRFLRAPDHQDAGVGNEGDESDEDSTQNPDNQNGNSGDSADGKPSKDNGGQPAPGKGFWDGKPEEGAGNDDSVEEGKAIGAELAGIIKGAQFGDVFSKEVTEKIAEGDFTAANQAIHESLRQSMSQSVGVFARLISAYGQRMEAQVEARIAKALGESDSNKTLEEHFPAAKDPEVRPLIQRAFDQAMVNTKGNRAEAVKQTKQMLTIFGEKTGLTTPPSDPGSGSLSGSSQSLVDELLDRTKG